MSFNGDFSNDEDIRSAADSIASGEAVAYDNDTVYALGGDAASPGFLATIALAKGSHEAKTVGLTVTAEMFLPLIDLDRVEPAAHPLLEDPATYASILGATAFVRAPGKRKLLNDGTPRSVLSLQDGLPIVQCWSPEGKDNSLMLIRAAGVPFMGVTSLNRSGEREITDSDAARRFCDQSPGISLLTDNKAQRKVIGSFPIVSFDMNGIAILRARPLGIGTRLIKALLDGYPVYTAKTADQDVHVGVFHQDFDQLRGSELRDSLLHYLGWTAAH